MANRFPIIVDSSGVPALKELASGDNLDLTGSGIVNAGAVNATTVNATTVNATTVAVTNLTVGGSQGTNGQTLQSTGSGVAWADAAGGGGAWSVVSSTTVSGTVASVEITLSGYDSYMIRIDKMDTSDMSNYSYLRIHFSVDGGSTYPNNFRYRETRKSSAYMNINEYTHTSRYSGNNSSTAIELMDIYSSSTASDKYPFAGYVTLDNNVSGTGAKTGTWLVNHTRKYSNVMNLFKGEGMFSVIETSPVNKVKFDINGNGARDIPVGSRFTLYGLSTS